MAIQRILFIFGFCWLASGKPTNEAVGENYCDPIVVTLKDYFSPRVMCHMGEDRIKSKQIQLFEKYVSELGINEAIGNPGQAIIQQLKVLIEAGTRSFQPPSLICTACSAAVQLFRSLIAEDMTPENIISFGEALCNDLNIMYPEMCNGIVRIYGESLIEILKRSPYGEHTFCSILFNGVCYTDATNNITWEVPIPKKKPPLLKLRENPGKPKIKVLHLSDIHWDLEYLQGTSAECRSMLCCRKGSVPIPGHEDLSGKYGGWKCDLPEAAFDNLLEHLKTQHEDVDYILWTGDVPAHDLWNQNEDNNYDILSRTLQKLEDAFPITPIYPALGNHESVPPNLFPTKKDVQGDPLSWLYQKLNKEWHFWLPGNNSETILRGGFYSVLAKPKLRIISMNMNYCYAMNWWLLVNEVDPEKELQWLVNELLKAEENSEKVHIIGHVPSGNNDCIKAWQTNFYKIVNRFENTVTAQFFGHTHTDEFEIFYDMEDNSRPFGIGYLGPSVTTYTYLNPGYRVYYVDGDYEGTTRYVLDHETWIMDLEQSNQQEKGIWRKLYSAKEGYNMTSLFPDDWNKLYGKLKKEESVMELYLKYYWKDSHKRPHCDAACKTQMLCDIRSCVQYGNPNV